jgi:hypothetical protein
MIADRTNSTQFMDEPEAQLSPPRFDENASANAQPVQPIPASRVAAWRQHAGSVWRAIGKRSRTLAVVVIAGLATGTLGGMAWVQHRQATSGSPAMNESVSELPGAASQDEQPGAPVIGGPDVQSTGSMITGPTTRIRKSRTRARSGRSPQPSISAGVRDRASRAYRVAVIR